MIVSLKNSRDCPTEVGPGKKTLVMALVGANHIRDYKDQIKKISALASMNNGPDIIADLSLGNFNPPLWKIAQEFGFITSVLPIYTVRRENKKIDSGELLNVVMSQMDGGVGMMTIHPTPTLDLIASARKRMVPWTSRGGGLVIEDMLSSNRPQSIYSQIMEELIHAAKYHSVAISIGASFRSANIFDSLDDAQRKEIESQLAFARKIAESEVGVVIESPGHAKPIDIQNCAKLFASSEFPIMPLGPIPTDIAIGFDHVAAAIGASLMGIAGAAHILAAVTREEHTGEIPSIESTLEAVTTARIAAHIIDIHQLNAIESDFDIATKRAASHTCVSDKNTKGCSRCGTACPL